MSFGATYATFATAMRDLGAAHPTICRRQTLGQAQRSGRDIHYLEIKPQGAPADRPVAVLLAGLHARELAPPATVMSFGVEFVKAFAAPGTDMTYAGFSDGAVPYAAWSIKAADVKKIVDALTVLVVPVANPDGRDFALAGSPWWRGNRSAGCAAHGVDLNRNFEVGWQTFKYYSAVDEAQIVPDATNPTCTDDTFRGTAPASEHETRNVQQLIDSHDVRFFIDVHSYGRRVLTPWGVAKNQATDVAQNFANAALDRRADGTGGRQVLSETYKEFLPDSTPHRVQRTHDQLAQAMVQAILDQAGANATARSRSQYQVKQIPELYKEFWSRPTIVPVPGSSADYALARQFRPGEPAPAYSMSMEIGWKPIPGVAGDPVSEGGFVPLNLRKYRKIERETHAALGAFLLGALKAHSSKKKGKK